MDGINWVIENAPSTNLERMKFHVENYRTFFSFFFFYDIKDKDQK